MPTTLRPPIIAREIAFWLTVRCSGPSLTEIAAGACSNTSMSCARARSASARASASASAARFGAVTSTVTPSKRAGLPARS